VQEYDEVTSFADPAIEQAHIVRAGKMALLRHGLRRFLLSGGRLDNSWLHQKTDD
jgi:hypothetical protein